MGVVKWPPLRHAYQVDVGGRGRQRSSTSSETSVTREGVWYFSDGVDRVFMVDDHHRC